LRIAIVDDEESIRRALKRLMISAGLNVDVYAGGTDFLAAVDASHPDCVILDLHMPGLTGFEVLERLGRSNSEIPVVTITGHDAPGTEARVLAGGASAYLRKPVNSQDLMGAIDRAIRHTGRSVPP
jgi:FixJ family two-component response regulator